MDLPTEDRLSLLCLLGQLELSSWYCMFVKAVDQIASGDHRRQALACVHAGVGTVLAASKSTGYQDRGRVRVCGLAG